MAAWSLLSESLHLTIVRQHGMSYSLFLVRCPVQIRYHLLCNFVNCSINVSNQINLSSTLISYIWLFNCIEWYVVWMYYRIWSLCIYNLLDKDYTLKSLKCKCVALYNAWNWTPNLFPINYSICIAVKVNTAVLLLKNRE